MKYIVTKQDNDTEEMFIFPDSVYHSDMADAVGYLKQHDRLIPGKWECINRGAISAGFVMGGKCVGASESLGLHSRETDTDMLP